MTEAISQWRYEDAFHPTGTECLHLQNEVTLGAAYYHGSVMLEPVIFRLRIDGLCCWRTAA